MTCWTALVFALLAMLARAEDTSCAPDFSAAAGDAPVPSCAAARYEAALARADRALRARFRWLQEERRFRGESARMPPLFGRIKREQSPKVSCTGGYSRRL